MYDYDSFLFFVFPPFFFSFFSFFFLQILEGIQIQFHPLLHDFTFYPSHYCLRFFVMQTKTLQSKWSYIYYQSISQTSENVIFIFFLGFIIYQQLRLKCDHLHMIVLCLHLLQITEEIQIQFQPLVHVVTFYPSHYFTFLCYATKTPQSGIFR